MTRRTFSKSAKPLAVAGGILALCLSAGCGSSGGGAVAPSATHSTVNLRAFDDTTSGFSLTAPQGYVVASTAAQAAVRFPAVLGTGADATTKIADAQTRLKATTIMVAYHAPIDGLFDNIGIIRAVGEAPTDPAELQSTMYQTEFRTSLTKAGARQVVFSATTLGGKPAEKAVYSITTTGSPVVYGIQFYVANSKDVFVVTFTAGSADRAEAASAEVAGSWTFS